MRDPTEKQKKVKVGSNWAVTLFRAGLFVLVVGCLTWGLSGSFGLRSAAWKEGQVAPYTVYAPFGYAYSDQGTQANVERGELIVSKGERLTAAHVIRLSALDRTQGASRTRPHWFGAALISLLFTGVGSIYLKRYEPVVWETPQRIVLTLSLSALVCAIAEMFISSPVDNAWIPVAAVALPLSMLLGPRLGIILGLLVTGLIGLLAQADLPLVIGFGAGCFVAATVAQGIRRRIHFFRAGLLVGAAQGLMILGGYLLMQWPAQAALGYSLAGVGSGILSAIITFCILPICESLFGLMSDVTLVEMSDLNHPLLKELSVKAPGTYHHSLIVANLAEGACEAVGANALLARVGCYFHDIGKMLHPEYFVENQPPDVSRHDHLSPSMSSLVILNHVKDGIGLARGHRINQAIIDFIPGHHGTGLIYYFYRRALEEVEDAELLKEERFRYPGPKPSTRETAIALLADSVEAAARALPQKTPARVGEVVRRIINNKFIDGQLDDCELTLRDLHRIAEAFLRVLAGIYHSRVEYPKAPGEESEIGFAAG